MAPAARVWMVYNDEAMKYVIESVEDWRDGLDMLLVFVSYEALSDQPTSSLSDLLFSGRHILCCSDHFPRSDLPGPSSGLRRSHSDASPRVD